MRPPDDAGLPRLLPHDLDWVTPGCQTYAIRAQWVDTRHGRRLVVVVALVEPGDSLPHAGGFRSYWTPRASSAILSRRFGSQDPAHWPDSFLLPLMIARNVKNPKTGERRDRVWVLPEDLWPEAASGGGSMSGSETMDDDGGGVGMVDGE